MSDVSLIEKIESELEIEEEKNAEKVIRTEKNKYMFVGITLFVLFVTLISFGIVQYKHKIDFNKAISYVEQNEPRKAAVLLQKLKGYASSEYELEKIYIENPQYRFLNAKEDDEFLFGTYVHDNNIKPIKWYVVEKEDDRVLLLSEQILDKYDYSGLETWYDTFKMRAFNEKERDSVSEITILSFSESRALFNDSKDYASATPTTYASSKTETYGSADKWWTSDTTGFSTKAYCMEIDGDDDTEYLNNSAGVRPAIWISLE